MARQKKNTIVDTVKHGSGASVDIGLNPTDLMFEAFVIKDVVFKAPSAQEVRRRVVEYLNSNTKIDWTAVICVSEQKPFCANDYAFIGIELSRFYLGKDSSGQFRELRWDDFDSHFGKTASDIDRINLSKKFYAFGDVKELQLPFCSDTRGEGQTYYIEYGEQTWTALEQIREAIATLKSRLRETLGSEEGLRRLNAFGARALLALTEKSGT